MEERGPLERQRKAATRKLRRGLVALVSVPIVILVAVVVSTYVDNYTFNLIVLANMIAYGLGASAGGVLLIKAGVAARVRVDQQLRDFDERHQLPEARLVIR